MPYSHTSVLVYIFQKHVHDTINNMQGVIPYYFVVVATDTDNVGTVCARLISIILFCGHHFIATNSVNFR